MNRAIIILLSVCSVFLIAEAARAADESDAKKLPEASSGASDNARLFDKLDANHDGFITTDEVPEESRRLFDRLIRRGDKNGDGKLSREEFISAISEERPAQAAEQATGSGPQAGGARAMGGFGAAAGGTGPFMGIAVFRALDTNGDGKLDAKEIAAAADVLKKLANKDGEITREELLKSLPPGTGPGAGGAARRPLAGVTGTPGGVAAPGEVNPEMAFKRMMSMFDKNGDGKLQKDELPPRLAERFDELDTNHDGALDESEIKAILPQLMRRLENAGAQGGAADGARQLRRQLIQDDAKPQEQKADAK
jgi:Ca2+-binding EF-hand superfamily protein